MDQSQMKFALVSPQVASRLLYFGVTTGVAQVETVTMTNFAGATQADFLVLSNKAGQKAALWIDKDAAGVLPTATAFLNCAIRTPISIVTGATAADAGAALATAAASLPGVTILDNTDGTVTFTQQIFGAVTPVAVSNAAGSGAGSISSVTGTAGVDVVVGNGKFDATVSQTGVGTFVITFREPFFRAPEVCGNSKTDNLILRITGSTTLAVTIELNNVTSGAAANGSFGCLVAGSNNADLSYQ